MRASILLVDDHPANLLAFEAILAPLGHHLVFANSGKEALKSILVGDFAVIVLDVRMPVIDGLETAALIKQAERSSHIPIIFVTANDEDVVEAARVYRYGAVDFLRKPFNPDILRSKVAVFVDLYLRGEKIKQQEAELHRQALEHAEKERERLARSLARSNEELDRFAYASSHDLKAPLRGIGYVVEWLEEDLGPTLPEAAKEKLTLLRSRAQRMASLIDGILDYSHAGKSGDTLKRVSVKALLEDVVDLLAPRPGATIELDPDLPTFVTEHASLRQVFMNLVDNAFKHGRRGGAVCVRVGACEDGAFYEFAVSDDGRGIAPEYHHKIWTLFQTLDARDREGGAGIGLSIVKKIVESRGGRAWVDSVPDHGATFRFTWPKAQPDA